MKNLIHSRLIYTACAVVLASQLSACVGLIAAGAAAGSAVSDRRSFGSNGADKQIEFLASNKIGEQFPLAHVNAQVYNGSVLLTGEVATAAQGKAVETLVRGMDGVRGVVNELAVGAVSGIGARTADTAITAKVNAAFVGDSLLQSGAFSITTERGNVYLQGRVTQAEGARAAELARQVSGVRQVVKVFEYLTDEEFRRLGIK